MLRLLVLMTAASTLIGCAASTPSAPPVVRTVLVRPVLPPVALQPCPAPVDLPDGRRMTAREITTAWGQDRTALVDCERRRAAAVAAVEGGR